SPGGWNAPANGWPWSCEPRPARGARCIYALRPATSRHLVGQRLAGSAAPNSAPRRRQRWRRSGARPARGPACPPGSGEGASGEGGIRTLLENPAITDLSAEGGAESGALTSKSAHTEPGLAQIVEAWSRLPKAIRKAMLVLVESETKDTA